MHDVEIIPSRHFAIMPLAEQILPVKAGILRPAANSMMPFKTLSICGNAVPDH